MVENFRQIEQRANIKFLVRLGVVSPTEIHDGLQQAYGDDAMSLTFVKKWAQGFREGRESLLDDPHGPHPGEFKITTCPGNVDAVIELILANKHITVTHIDFIANV